MFLRDVWPSATEVQETVLRALKGEMFRSQYANVFAGDDQWQALDVPTGDTYAWVEDSTYVKNPPYFEGMTMQPPGVVPIAGARALAMLGDSITTDHISPAGNIPAVSPAGKWLIAQGVKTRDFNSYGARRGNHAGMIRGRSRTSAWHELAPGPRLWTATAGERRRDSAQRRVPRAAAAIVIAGKEYGTGSSRDWAAKGTLLLGVRAVIAESFERIHRSNLVGMGVLPLEFTNGETRQTLGLTGFETFEIEALSDASLKSRAQLTVVARQQGEADKRFTCARASTRRRS